MRADMAKVIVERPRKKGCAWHKPKGYQRRLRRYGEDGPPAREGIKACWQGRTKYLNEHLGPLRRYLDKQVGRPWDKVFSEICAHIDRGSAVQDHVRDHVEDYVTVHVILVDGVPCSGGGDWRQYGRPLHEIVGNARAEKDRRARVVRPEPFVRQLGRRLEERGVRVEPRQEPDHAGAAQDGALREHRSQYPPGAQRVADRGPPHTSSVTPMRGARDALPSNG